MHQIWMQCGCKGPSWGLAHNDSGVEGQCGLWKKLTNPTLKEKNLGISWWACMHYSNKRSESVENLIVFNSRI